MFKLMKFLFLSIFSLLLVSAYSQDLSKYDDSYGIFIINFKINQNGKAKFISVDTVQCKECSEEIINFFKRNSIKSFNKMARNLENKYQNNGNQTVNFKLPIIIKIEELNSDFDKKRKKTKDFNPSP